MFSFRGYIKYFKVFLVCVVNIGGSRENKSNIMVSLVLYF